MRLTQVEVAEVTDECHHRVSVILHDAWANSLHGVSGTVLARRASGVLELRTEEP